MTKTLKFLTLLAILSSPFWSYSQPPDISFKEIKDEYSNLWIVNSDEKCPTVNYNNGVLSIKVVRCMQDVVPGGIVNDGGSVSLEKKVSFSPGSRLRIKFSYSIHGSAKISLFAHFDFVPDNFIASQFLRKDAELHSQSVFKQESQKTNVVLYLYFLDSKGVGPGETTVAAEYKSGTLTGQFSTSDGKEGDEVKISDLTMEAY